MGTIVYCSSTAANSGPTPAVHTNWARTSTGFLRQAGVASIDSSALTDWSDASQAAIQKTCGGQWVYGPIGAQTISGTCKIVVRGSSTSGIAVSGSAAIRIVDNTGALVADLLGNVIGDGQAWTTSDADYSFGAITLTSGTAADGNYLALELGWHTTTTNADVFKIAAGANLANSHARFEFSQTILNQGAISGGGNSLILLGVGS